MSDLPCTCVGMADGLRTHQVVITKDNRVIYAVWTTEGIHRTQLSIKCPFCGEKLWRNPDAPR